MIAHASKGNYLQRLFGQYNWRYFGSRLSKSILIIQKELPKRRYGRVMHNMRIRRANSSKWTNVDILILINTAHRRNEQRLTLLHEMVHVDLDMKGHSRVQHGKLFQKEMLRLAKAGALSKLW
jgi:Zn-dependent peptidase ImmA (M78 family)